MARVNTMAEEHKEPEHLITEGVKVRRAVEIVVSAQALRILNLNNLSIEEFVDWSLNENKISFGGHNVMLWMESLYERKVNENRSSTG
jgi:hypothetical protein